MSKPFTFPIRSMASGEISPDMFGRIDQIKYQTGLSACRNFITRPEGSAENRTGTAYVMPLWGVDNESEPRFLEFIFNDNQAYVLVLQYNATTGAIFSVIRNGAPIFDESVPITGITASLSMTVTSAAHGLANNEMVYISGVSGMVEANNRFARVNNVATNTFELWETSAINSSSYAAYTSGGTAQRIYTQTLPAGWGAVEIDELRYSQSGDVITITHPNAPTVNITRVAEDDWQVDVVVFEPAIEAPTNISGTGTAGSDTVRYRVTAVAQDTLEESYPSLSNAVSVTNISSTVPDATKAIVDAFQENPLRIESTSHGYSTGDFIYIASVSGMTQINDKYFKVVVLSSSFYTLQDENGNSIDGTSYGVYGGGGTTSRVYRHLVTTGTAHGLVDNDEVIMNGLTGFADLNGYYITVDVITTTTFRANRKYGASTTSVAQTGTVSRTPTAIVNVIYPTATNSVTLNWTPIDNALEYRIYREANGIYGYIGASATPSFEDLGYEIDLVDTPPIVQSFFANTGEYPQAVGHYQQRLLLGGPDNDPERIRASRTGLFYNFSKSNPIQADDSISWIMASGQSNRIRHFLDMGRLLVFTQGAVFSIEGDDSGTLTATAINPRLRSDQGVGDVEPITVNDVALFVQTSGRVIREILPDQGDRYASNDLTVFQRHLFENTYVTHWTYAEEPTPIIWVTQANGSLLGCTYMRKHEILGWHRHDTGDGDEFIDVASIPENNESAVYVAVKRYNINGQTRTGIERFASRYGITEADDGRFLDCHGTYSGAPADVIAGLWQLEGRTVYALADNEFIGPFTVTNGKVTLNDEFSEITVGLRVTSELTTLEPEDPNQPTWVDRSKSVSQVTVRVKASNNFEVSADGSSYEMFTPEHATATTRPENLALYTGKARFNLASKSSDTGRVWIRQRSATPTTILGIYPKIVLGD